MKHRSRRAGRSIVVRRVALAVVALCGLTCTSSGGGDGEVSLDPENWRADYDDFMTQQLEVRSSAGSATGTQGAVTVAYNALAARAGPQVREPVHLQEPEARHADVVRARIGENDGERRLGGLRGHALFFGETPFELPDELVVHGPPGGKA